MNLWTAFPGWTRRRQLISVINECINMGTKIWVKIKSDIYIPIKRHSYGPSQLDYDVDKKSVIGSPFGSPTLYSLLLLNKVLSDKITPSSSAQLTIIHRSLNLGCIYFYGSMLMAFNCKSSCLVSEGYSGTCCCFIIVGAAAGHHLPLLLFSRPVCVLVDRN